MLNKKSKTINEEIIKSNIESNYQVQLTDYIYFYRLKCLHNQNFSGGHPMAKLTENGKKKVPESEWENLTGETGRYVCLFNVNKNDLPYWEETFHSL